MKTAFKYLSIAYLLLATSVGFAQNQNPLNLRVGEFVFYRILEPRYVAPKSAADVKKYQIKTPLYLIGKIISFQDNIAQIEAQTFLYTCSMTSGQWNRTPIVELEKHSGGQIETEVWDLSNRPQYKKSLFFLHPYNEESLVLLTGNGVNEIKNAKASCEKIIVIDIRNQKK